jgi:deoxyribonuclease IV
MLVGAHVDPTDPIAAATELGVNAVQFFLGDPKGWKGPQVSYPAGPDVLRADADAAGIALYIHAPYVLNVASTNNRIRIPSRQQLQKQLNLAAQIGAAGLVVHGGHVLASDDPQAGFDNWLKAADGLNIEVPLLIENTAGGAHAMARTPERLEQLWQAISASKNADRIGFCLDTCHAHAAGWKLDGLVDQIMAITGRIDLVHGNDSRDDFGSGADRHANLGAGKCDLTGLAQVFTTAGAPIILETPGDAQARRADLEWLNGKLKQ